MTQLKEILGGKEHRNAVIHDCLDLIEREVKSKSGFSGMALKAGYAVVKGVKPTFVQESIEHLLDPFAEKLDPIYQEAKQNGSPVDSYFDTHRSRLADALLSITDERAKRAKSPTVVKAYEKLRGSAKTHVEAAMPEVGKLITKYDS